MLTRTAENIKGHIYLITSPPQFVRAKRIRPRAGDQWRPAIELHSKSAKGV